MFDLLPACSDEMSGPVGKGRVVATTYLGLNMAFDNTFPSGNSRSMDWTNLWTTCLDELEAVRIAVANSVFEPKPALQLLFVQTQLGRDLGSQQQRSKRLEKLCVFRSTGLDGNHPKLSGGPGGPDCEATINTHP
ncbi:hypothetical protein HGM15179_000579 [Zosterops borbonicus]|uniref:Uncharacterized protein n=1 Tax=Zosterops borbonicus TaxID=364589 RepID=A0A8K1GYR4_9PASS|nr:hypothetical protein HGM15179_000579 [Zosterops borbonicus]